MTVGRYMRAARLRAGLTMTELATRAGVSLKQLGNLERERNPYGRLDTITLLADALGVSIDEYIGHEVRRDST